MNMGLFGKKKKGLRVDEDNKRLWREIISRLLGELDRLEQIKEVKNRKEYDNILELLLQITYMQESILDELKDLEAENVQGELSDRAKQLKKAFRNCKNKVDDL